MATTMKLIAKVSLGSDAANIEFTSIPGTYTDLVILSSLRSDRASPNLRDVGRVRFNGDAGTNYTSRELYSSISAGIGASANESSQTGGRFAFPTSLGATANTFSSDSTYIPNYAGNTNKSWSSDSVAETNATGNEQIVAIAGLWSNTSAITSILLYPQVGSNFKSGSSAFLYGITKA